MWQAAATTCAEAVDKSLRLRDLKCSNQIFATEPRKRCRLKEKIRRMPCTRCLAAARTMAVVEALRLAGHFVLHGATQTTAFKNGLGHNPSPIDYLALKDTAELSGKETSGHIFELFMALRR